MRNARFILLPFALAGGILYARAQAGKLPAAEAVISQVQKQVAPDKRLAVFELKALTEGKALLINGVTDQKSVADVLAQKLQEAGIFAKIDLTTLPDPGLGDQQWGLVNVSVANIRSEPKHSAELATQALLGTPLKVLRRQGDWFQVQMPDQYIGWLENGGFTPYTGAGMASWRQSERLIFMGDFALCFAEPGAAIPVSDIVAGGILQWDADTGRLRFPDGRTALLPSGDWLRMEDWSQRSGTHFDSLYATAARFSGRPYLWGGTSAKGMDCSGFTKTVYFLHGMIIPRDASQQVHAGTAVTLDDDLAALHPGDFLFFGNYRDDGSQRITHVGIYTGNGRFIHSGSDNGFICTQSLRPGDPDFQSHRRQSLLQARRLSPGATGVSRVIHAPWYFP